VGCEVALHACKSDVNDYCAVFGLSLRSYDKVIQIIVISVLVLVLLVYTSKQGHTILPPDY
jgi:hypothetical protein